MVQLAIPGLVGLLALLQPTLAAPQRNIGASDATTCVANGKLYHSGRSYKMFGASYVVRCAKDSTGKMTHSQSVTRDGFTVCAESCERTNGCAGFSYVGSDEGGTCYFKADVGGWSTASDDLVSCWKDANNNGGEPEPVPSHRVNIRKGSPTSSLAVSGSASVSASASVPTSVHVSSTAAKVPAPSHVGHCQQAVAAHGEVYRDGKGYSYKLACGEDHSGGDLHAVKSKSFLGCTKLCDANPECIGYAYTPGVCFLKRHLTGTEINAGVDFAINIDRNGTASTPVSTSSSAPGRMLTVTVTSYTSSAMPSTTSAPGGFLTTTSSATPSSHRTKQHGHHHFSKFMSVFYSKHSRHFGSHNHTKSAHRRHHYHTVTHHHTHNHTVSESHHTKSHHHHSHHTTPTEAVAVATAYVSQTYTQTNYVTSVSSSSIPSDLPTSTYTKQPIKPTPVGDKVYCNELRNQKPKKLRTEVLKGEHRFHGLWVEDPTRAHNTSMAHLTHSEAHAASIAVNPAGGAVSAWHNTDGCSFRGLNLHYPDFQHPHADRGRKEKHGDCVFSAGHGTAGMALDDNYLQWYGPHFDLWLVCETEHKELELKFWGKQVRGTWREEPYRCAEVKLRAVE